MLRIYLQLLVSGIAMGFVYGLVGIEYTLIWNATGLLNFSHERIIMLGAYVFAGTMIMDLGMGVIPGIAGVLLFMIIFAVIVALVIFIPLRNMSRICAIMATVMLGNIINEAVRLFYGPEAMSVKGFLSGTLRVGNMVVARGYVAIIAVALVILVLLLVFMKKNKNGQSHALCIVQQNGLVPDGHRRAKKHGHYHCNQLCDLLRDRRDDYPAVQRQPNHGQHDQP